MLAGILQSECRETTTRLPTTVCQYLPWLVLGDNHHRQNLEHELTNKSVIVVIVVIGLAAAEVAVAAELPVVGVVVID